VPASDLAIVVIAVAVTAQALMTAVACVVVARAWRQAKADVRAWQASLDERLDLVSERIDEAVVDARLAARSVETLATRANGLMQDAATAAHTVRTAVTMPRAIAVTGAASVTKWLLSKWRIRRRQSPPPVAGEELAEPDVF
jgi:hypothetical protein